MFSNSINGYRQNQSKVVQIKGTAIANDEKQKSFDRCCDYIRSYDAIKSPKLLLEEILGLSQTSCKYFNECAIDNSYFFYDEITKPITCFICLVYFKYNAHILININNTKSDPIKIKQWLKEIGINDIIIKKIKNQYIQQIVIQNEKIIFSDKYSPIKLTKLNQRDQISKLFRYTNKTQQLKPDELCVNDDPEGHCLALANWYLIEIAKAYDNSNLIRKKIKNLYIWGLKRDSNIEFKMRGINAIIDKNIQNHILKFKSKLKLPIYFRHIQDLYTSNYRLSSDVVKLINLIEINKLTRLYIQMITDNHVMGISFVVKGKLIKILLYDPNDLKSYRNIIIDPEFYNEQFLDEFFITLPYFVEQQKTIPLVLRCYGYKIQDLDIIQLNNDLNKLSDTPNKILHLGILTFHLDLIAQAIKEGAKDKFALIMAIKINSPMEIIKSILELLPDSINYIEIESGNTALCYAVINYNIELINLLILSGAQLKVAGANSGSP